MTEGCFVGLAVGILVGLTVGFLVVGKTEGLKVGVIVASLDGSAVPTIQLVSKGYVVLGQLLKQFP